MLRKLYYDRNTTDWMVYKRRKVSPLSDAEQARADYAVQQKWQEVREAHLLKVVAQLTSESQGSEERIVSEENEQRLDLPMNESNSASRGNEGAKSAENGAAVDVIKNDAVGGELCLETAKAASAEKDPVCKRGSTN